MWKKKNRYFTWEIIEKYQKSDILIFRHSWILISNFEKIVFTIDHLLKMFSKLNLMNVVINCLNFTMILKMPKINQNKCLETKWKIKTVKRESFNKMQE